MPLHRLIEPNWPVSIHEYLDENGQPALHRADTQTRAAGRLRSRPLSAAMVDTSDGAMLLGYPVVVRGAGSGPESDSESESESDAGSVAEPGTESVDRASSAFPSTNHWRPPERDACELGVLVDGAMVWLDCVEVARVLRPNAMPWWSRLAAAVDRLRRDRPDVKLEGPISRDESGRW